MSENISVLYVGEDPGFDESRFDVLTASTPSELFELAEQDHEIDCIVSDYDLVDSDGIELLKRVKENGYRNVPFILYPQDGSEELAAKAFRTGVTDYVSGSEKELFDSIENAVDLGERFYDPGVSTVTKNLPVVLFSFNSDGVFTFSKGKALQSLGLSPGEVVGESVFDVYENYPDIVENCEKALEGNEVHSTTQVGDVYFDYWLQPVYGPDENKVVAVNGIAIDVTERQEIQKKLEEERDRFAALFENLGEPVVEVEFDEDKPKILGINSKFEEVFDIEEQEAVGKLLDDIIVPSGRVDEATEINKKAKQGQHVEYEVERKTKNGLKEFLFRSAPYEIGETVRGHGIYIDISEQRRREQVITNLHDASRRLMKTQSRDEVAEIAADTSRNILEFPAAVVRLFDGGDDEYMSTIEASDPNKILGNFFCSMGEKAVEDSYRDEETIVIDDPSDIEDLPDSVKSAMHIPLIDYGVLSVYSDRRDDFGDEELRLATVLSDNVKTALDLIEYETELRNERDRFVTLFHNIPNPVVYGVADEDNQRPIVLTVNPAFEEVFGYDSDEIEGKYLDKIVPSSLNDEADAINQRVIEEGELRTEVKRQTAEGIRDFVLEINTHEVEGKIEGYAIYTDITRRKEREKELKRQNERLEEFASIVSHDLRNPLSIAESYTDLVKRTGDEEYLEKISDAHHRMERIIEDVLALARQGEKVEETEEVDLEKTAKKAWGNVETYEAQLRTEEITLDADEPRLTQILENLFRNAVEHGGKEVTVTVGSTQEGFYIEDDGTGIPEDKREDVFKKGYTTQDDGTGFGLSIVETIVEAHSWELSLEESNSGGARFEIKT